MTNELIPNEHERIKAIVGACVSTNLRKTTRIVSAHYDALMRSTGLHANQIMLLVPLYLAGPTPINQVATWLSLDRTTLQRNLKPIEALGLVSIRPGDDLRTRIVSLTEAGRRKLVEGLPLWEKAQREVLQLLGEQHAQLVGILEQLDTLAKVE